MNKVNGGDGILVDIFQTLKDDAVKRIWLGKSLGRRKGRGWNKVTEEV